MALITFFCIPCYSLYFWMRRFTLSLLLCLYFFLLSILFFFYSISFFFYSSFSTFTVFHRLFSLNFESLGIIIIDTPWCMHTLISRSRQFETRIYLLFLLAIHKRRKKKSIFILPLLITIYDFNSKREIQYKYTNVTSLTYKASCIYQCFLRNEL